MSAIRERASMTVGGVLVEAAHDRPEATAVICGEESVSYRELLERAERSRLTLERSGLRAGSRMLVMLENSIDYLAIWLGASLGGVVEIPVNPDFRGQMLRYVLEDSSATTIVTEAAFLTRLEQALGDGVQLEVALIVGAMPERGQRQLDLRPFEKGHDDDSSASPAPPVRECDPTGILYTSGTTGPAKGTLIAHKHAFRYARACVDLLELEADDVYYAPLPLFHIAGQWAVALASMIAGATTVIKPRFSVSEFWEDCDRHGVTATFLLGAMAQFLNRREPDAKDRQHTLERILMVPLVENLQEFRERFAVRVTTCYGSTETGVPIVADYDVTEPTVTGRAAPGYELRILDEDDEPVDPGGVGELCVRTSEPWVTMVEYLDKPEATAHAFRNQWLHSGDAMRLDESGVYHFVDRLDDALRRRGENISSFEVEREVYAHEAVQECAAIGVPSPNTEDDLVVVLVKKPGHTLTPEQLTAFIAEHAPRFMVPDRVVIREALPKTSTGKIQKNLLKREVSATPMTSDQSFERLSEQGELDNGKA